MRRTLQAIASHPKLQLQIVVTGMHLDSSLGRSARSIEREGWKIDSVVPWPGARSPAGTAHSTGRAMAGIAKSVDRLGSDVVLVVGDRVEAFAAAAAGHIAGKAVAHIHGGDRALGLVDDSLRHAITKLAHLHFAATRDSARRIERLGELRRRVHVVGSPGLDSIHEDAVSLGELAMPVQPRRYALLVLHPASSNATQEQRRARSVLDATQRVGFDQIVVVYPNNDPGAAGIVSCWERRRKELVLRRNLHRNQFLGLLRDAAVLVGNSSSGIIEAASFGTLVVDIGPRQQGRLRSQNVTNVPYDGARIERQLARIWNGGRPRRWRGGNVYGGGNAARQIASILASIEIDADLLRKLIAY